MHIQYLILILYLGLTSQALAAQSRDQAEDTPLIPPEVLSPKWYRGYTIATAIAIKTTTFIVKDETTNQTLGKLRGKDQIVPALYVDTPYRYFGKPGNHKFGWHIEYGYSSFEADGQIVGNSQSTVDMGTSVKGQYIHVTPTIFYNLGDPYSYNSNGASFKMGLGIGLSYLRARGDIILTEANSERVNVDIDQVTMSINIMLDFQFDSFSLRTRTSGPAVDDRDKTYQVIETTFEFSYLFRL